MRIIALDPSGAFAEGKGTTGWCLIDGASIHPVVLCGELKANAFKTAEAYWQAHCDLIAYLCKTYNADVLVMEDYVLYADQAMSQVNSSFETSQLIGILKLECARNNLPVKMQRAGVVKPRWKNSILVFKGIVTQKGKFWYVRDQRINGHILDSIRHGIHYLTFGGKDGTSNSGQNSGTMRDKHSRYVDTHARSVRSKQT
jgi:hypothetical protein